MKVKSLIYTALLTLSFATPGIANATLCKDIPSVQNSIDLRVNHELGGHVAKHVAGVGISSKERLDRAIENQTTYFKNSTQYADFMRVWLQTSQLECVTNRVNAEGNLVERVKKTKDNKAYYKGYNCKIGKFVDTPNKAYCKEAGTEFEPREFPVYIRNKGTIRDPNWILFTIFPLK